MSNPHRFHGKIELFMDQSNPLKGTEIRSQYFKCRI